MFTKINQKKILILIVIFISVTSLYAHEFGYPVQGEKWYFIKTKVPIEPQIKEGIWKITDVWVNSTRVRDFVLSQRHKEIFNRELKGSGPFALKVRYNWKPEEIYKLKALLKNKKTKKSIFVEKSIKSPPKKGYWNPEWKNYISISIQEENGYKRINYPIHATIGILSDYFHSPDEIRIVKAEKEGNDVSYTEYPSQVYDIITWKDEKLLSVEERDEETGKVVPRYYPTTTLSIAFQVDIKPHEKTTYLVFYNNPSAKKPVYKTDLIITGKGLAKTIENTFYKVVLQEKSGMVHEIYEKESGIKLEHKLETNGAIHWNPGVYSPPHTWSHCSDWENPRFSEERGPIFYSLRREAPLPHLKDAHASVTYYFYKNSPFILTESSMEIKKDIFVKALRSGEVVFNKEVFTKAAYKTAAGKQEIIDFSYTRMHPEHVAVLSADTPWVYFFDKDKKIGFANLFLQYSTLNIQGGVASTQQPYIYIQHGPWYYMSRAFVYSFGSNNQSRMLPVRKGSLYFEKNAWIPFSFKGKKDCSRYLDTYFSILKYPLAIKEHIETYPESPEGWLVPILTEPFEEGVKGALGGKKKKDKK